MNASSAAYHALAEENAELRTRMSGLHQQVASFQAQLAQTQAENEKLAAANMELKQAENSERQQRTAAESSLKDYEQRWRQTQNQLDQRDSLVREWRNKCTVVFVAFDDSVCVSPRRLPSSASSWYQKSEAMVEALQHNVSRLEGELKAAMAQYKVSHDLESAPPCNIPGPRRLDGLCILHCRSRRKRPRRRVRLSNRRRHSLKKPSKSLSSLPR